MSIRQFVRRGARLLHAGRDSRIVWTGAIALLIGFFSDDECDVTATTDGESVHVSIDGEETELSRDQARTLKSALGRALTGTREFLRTAGQYREDGRYEVRRRGADSSGNAKVFADFSQLERLYRRLPDEFTADDVGGTGITGSRRHMLAYHFAEHPAFDCAVTCRNPLTVRKGGDDEVGEAATERDREASAD